MSQEIKSRPDIIQQEKEEVKKPQKWNVILLNDDFTPMDFVINLLVYVFGHEKEQAVSITLKVHNDGRAIAGTYCWEIAETKTDKVLNLAAQEEYPLQAIIEPQEGI